MADISSGKLQNSVDYLMNVYSDNQDNTQAGSLIFNSIAELETLYAQQKAVSSELNEQYQAVKNLKTFLDLASVAVFPNDSAYKAGVIPYLKFVSKFVDVLAMPLKKKADAASSAASSTGKIRIIQSEMTFSGGITNFTGKEGFTFRLPGRSGNSTECEAFYYPKYNEVLGRFALLETPAVEIGTSINVEQPPLETTVIQRFSFDKNSFKYMYNPAAKINTENSKIYAAIVVKKKNVNIPPSSGPSYSFFTNIDSISSLSNNDTTVYITQFVPIECLEEMGAELYFRGGVSASEFTPIYDVQLKLLIMYNFDAIGTNSEQYKTFELVTYPVKQITKSYGEVSPPVRNADGSTIQNNITISTINYTSNQTIFAWDTIIINGDLTANTGIEVEISASVIIMNSGSLGQGITLIEKETPFASCTSLTAFDPVDLGGYCRNENKYKANQNKNAKLIDDTPIKEKPQTTIAFQSTPNPFTNSFNLEFELEEGGETSLIVYDALGRVVETVIVNDNLSIGKHQYQIDGTKLGSGVYYVKLNHSNGTQTIKIIKQ